MMTRCDLHEVDVDRRGCPWCQLEEAQEQVAIYKDQRQDWFDEAEKLRNEKRNQTDYDGHGDSCDCGECYDKAHLAALGRSMEPKPRNCNENCPGNIEHRTPVSIISRVNYRLAHNVLSLSADDEWLMKDAVFCVMELVAEVEKWKKLFEAEDKIARELVASSNMWRASYESLVEEAKQDRKDAQKFYGTLVRIVDEHNADYTGERDLAQIAREALADRP